jgi:hypothetical protein
MLCRHMESTRPEVRAWLIPNRCPRRPGLPRRECMRHASNPGCVIELTRGSGDLIVSPDRPCQRHIEVLAPSKGLAAADKPVLTAASHHHFPTIGQMRTPLSPVYLRRSLHDLRRLRLTD